jgi:hypothetical protein
VETLRAEPVAPFHFTSYTRRPSGEFPFTHGQARGTLPFGLLEYSGQPAIKGMWGKEAALSKKTEVDRCKPR